MTRHETLPRDPKTVAEMIPVRKAELAARPRPRCSVKGHGLMVARPLDRQTYEVMWVGTWYDCTQPQCTNSGGYYSRELAAYHGMPYVVDSRHAEVWDGSQWQPITQAEHDDYWADYRASQERVAAEQKARIKRAKSASHRHARGLA